MTIVADHEVTPSDEIDQVWHLHLTYTKDYWDEFCQNILQQPLHHNPTKGGPGEDKRFFENYKNTLTKYKREFGTEPPKQFWPDPDHRFDTDVCFQRIDKNKHWVIKIPEFLRQSKTSQNNHSGCGGGSTFGGNSGCSSGCGGGGCGS